MKGIAFAFMSAFLLLACSTKEISPLEKRMAAKMSFMKVDSKIVKGFNYRTNMNGLLEFELVLLSDEDLELEYKVSWLDEDGFVLKGQKDGEFIRIKLNENKEYLLQRVAINKDATDFTLLLRKK